MPRGIVYIIEFQLLNRLPLGKKGKKFIKIEEIKINFGNETCLLKLNNSLINKYINPKYIVIKEKKPKIPVSDNV